MFTNICPICGSDDQCQNVGAIIQESTDVNVNVGAVFGGGGIAPLATGGLSRSVLAMSLMPRKRAPGDLSVETLFLWSLGLAVITGIILEAIWAPQFPISFDIGKLFSWAFFVAIFGALSLPVWMLLSIPVMIIASFSRPRAVRRYNESLAYLNASYYCRRDGIVFDGVNHGAPQAFVQFVFSNRR